MPDITYVKMPQTDYVAIADATRAKTGTTGTLTSGQVAEKINGIETMTASVEGKTLVLTGNASVSGGTLNIG